MPQMMPMLWMSIFFISLMSLFTLIFQLYFFMLPKLNKNKSKFIISMNSHWLWQW